MVLNAVQNGAKRETKSIKIHCKWYKLNHLEPETHGRKGRNGHKKWGFRGKKCVIGPEKIRAGNQTRKAKWCKMQVLNLKTDKTQGVSG